MPRRKIGTNHHCPNTLLITQATTASTEGFFDNACYEFYLRRLFHSLHYYQVKLHAYALLPDRVWLLVTVHTGDGARALLESVNRAYGEYFNTRFQRQCRMWSSRPRQTSLASDAAVLACHKLVEGEPAYSGCVTNVGQWCWSSYCINAFGARHEFVNRHPAVVSFFRRFGDPGANYRAYVQAGFARGQYEYLRGRVSRNQPLAGPSASLNPSAAPDREGHGNLRIGGNAG